MTLETISEARCFGGVQGVYSHAAETTQCAMRFSVYRPPQAETGPVPVLYWLSGLTCTEENFTVKAGAQRYAAEHGVMLVAPDTSPRGVDLPGEDESYDFGSGAGFYVDATEAPWSAHYRMYSYITAELPKLILGNFPGDAARQGVFGHSMGGHGALVCALRNPEPLQVGVGLRADRGADPGAVGREGVLRLSRRGPGELAAIRCLRADPRRRDGAGHPGRSGHGGRFPGRAAEARPAARGLRGRRPDP